MTKYFSTTDLASDAVQRLQNILTSYVSVLGNLGALVGIHTPHGRIRLTAGKKDIGDAPPVHHGNLYRIASQSKTFVATAMLLLSRRGCLDLDASVVSLLDIPIDPRITVRHLLMNTSGLGEFFFSVPSNRIDPRIKVSPRDMVAAILPQGQRFEPGDHFDYCNTGWTIGAMIIEKITGQPYGDIIRKIILDPLRMDDTGFGGFAPKERMVKGYILSQVQPEPIDASDALGTSFGSGDGVSKMDDMLHFFSSLMDPHSPVGVSIGDLCKVTAKPSENPIFALSIGAEYGLGIERRAWAGREVWGHPGSVGCYLSSSWIDPGLKVAVTTCVTSLSPAPNPVAHLRYPREQLFAMALNTAYSVAHAGRLP